ncbi:hypothetical protein TGAM01_v210853, partial [Trichoderma gamsii]
YVFFWIINRGSIIAISYICLVIACGKPWAKTLFPLTCMLCEGFNYLSLSLPVPKYLNLHISDKHDSPLNNAE